MNVWGDSKSSSPLFVGGLNDGPKVINSSIKVRMAYLRKVYTILSVQLALTTVISVFIMLMPAMLEFVIRNQWVLLVNGLAGMFCAFALISKRNEYPTNFYLLGAFTLLNSFTIGILVSLFEMMLVAQAFFLTAVVVVGLTIYTFQTKRDFEWLGGTLYSFLTIAMFAGFIQIFLRSNFIDTVLTVSGACIFSAYIIYDTQQIMKHLSAEEYIIGVINLYMDIINLFVKILKILSMLKNSESSEEKSKKKRRE